MTAQRPQTLRDGDSDAALRVLTDAALFRFVISWTPGWPGLVAAKLLPSLTPSGASWRTDAATATDALLRVADVRTLEAARHAQWWDRNGRLVGISLLDATQAIRSGNAVAVRFVCASVLPLDTSRPDMRYNYWSAAVLHCRGQCELLDVVHEVVSSTGTSSMYTFSSDYMLRIQHVAVARWFVDRFGPASLPPLLSVTAVRKGYLGLYYYLRKLRGQDHASARPVATSVLDTDKERLRVMITQVDELTVQLYGNRLLSLAAKSEDAELIEQVLRDWSSQCGDAAVREATDALARLVAVE